ncbi:carbohydrate ABC transporter permease [Actinomyces sp. zg-332]|uniref:carbohydrate ABC transporter permease n=1 Tax=Actinomyces sp. zg-332 TaxID=2708340 RepID=UPI00141F43B3|nr:carbohydrate ABC transporter permease [Actinomyces sp. zg-332]QPK94235.1 carbohydrate ABC transporter permease [Actinomyces sp. zg-332]
MAKNNTSSVVQMKRRKDKTKNWMHSFLLPLAAIWMLPIFLVLSISLLPASNPKTTALGLFPESASFSNYILIWKQNPLFGHLINSLLITVPSVILTVLVGSMMAFALARLQMRGKKLMFGVLVGAMVLPMASIIVATYKILQYLNLYNSLVGLVLVYTALGIPFATIMIRNAFMAIPDDTYEAALIDGASKWRIYWSIYLPLARPSLAVVIVWQSMMSWNDFLLPLVSIADNALKPLVLVPLAYRGIYLSQPGGLFAILVVVSIPMVVIFLLVQKNLVNGLSGAVK